LGRTGDGENLGHKKSVLPTRVLKPSSFLL
jgi:hypothetical protein